MMRPPYNQNRLGGFGCLAGLLSMVVLAWGLVVLVVWAMALLVGLVFGGAALLLVLVAGFIVHIFKDDNPELPPGEGHEDLAP